METLLNELPVILKQLQVDNFYLMNLDVTKYFVRIFNKLDMCDYLMTNHNFCLKESTKKTDVIVDKDNTVGSDCLTGVGGKVRLRTY